MWSPIVRETGSKQPTSTLAPLPQPFDSLLARRWLETAIIARLHFGVRATSLACRTLQNLWGIKHLADAGSRPLGSGKATPARSKVAAGRSTKTAGEHMAALHLNLEALHDRLTMMDGSWSEAGIDLREVRAMSGAAAGAAILLLGGPQQVARGIARELNATAGGRMREAGHRA